MGDLIITIIIISVSIVGEISSHSGRVPKIHLFVLFDWSSRIVCLLYLTNFL